MPRKLKLTPDISYDYGIFGISCHLRDYRFTFFLNAQLKFRFKRIEDLRISGGGEERCFSLYKYAHPDERRNYYLVSNYHESGRLVPSEKGADFFLIVDDLLPATHRKHLLQRIQGISHVLAAYEIPWQKQKDVEVIVTEIEMHLL